MHYVHRFKGLDQFCSWWSDRSEPQTDTYIEADIAKADIARAVAVKVIINIF